MQFVDFRVIHVETTYYMWHFHIYRNKSEVPVNSSTLVHEHCEDLKLEQLIANNQKTQMILFYRINSIADKVFVNSTTCRAKLLRAQKEHHLYG